MTTPDTPALWTDLPRLERNLHRMQQRADRLGVRFRPHVKTHKCLPVVQRQLALGAHGITVSTLAEAEHFFRQGGVADILYAVALAPVRYARAARLMAEGARLSLLVDGPGGAQALADWAAAEGVRFTVMLEIDSDGHRAGMSPEDTRLVECAQILDRAGQAVAGVLTHGGGSYHCTTKAQLAAHAERERQGAVAAALALRHAGFAAAEVSVGSTPTAHAAQGLEGVTELRAGVYAFHDLVMLSTGCCERDDLALAVRTSVIGHSPQRSRLFVDAGWMALSRDRGTAGRERDWGYGALRDPSTGQWLDELRFVAANQEHGVIEGPEHWNLEQRFPVGTALDVFPNHACATVAQHGRMHPIDEGGLALQPWPLLRGW